MKTEIRRFVAVVSALGLLASCAQTGTLEVQSNNTSGAARGAGTSTDHGSIVKRYENTAKEIAWHQKVLSAIFPLQRCTIKSEMGFNKS